MYKQTKQKLIYYVNYVFKKKTNFNQCVFKERENKK